MLLRLFRITLAAIRSSEEVESKRKKKKKKVFNPSAAGGKDATALFESMHPNADVRAVILPKYKIGTIDQSTVPRNQVLVVSC
jgi:hypothetical protein